MGTDIYTYRTPATGESQLLFSASKWARVTLALETAGPVAIGTRQDVTPVLGGRGVLLEPDGEPLQFLMGLGDRLYIAAEADNRVKVIIEPLPWLEQVVTTLHSGFNSLLRMFRSSRPAAPPPPPCPPDITPPEL